LAIISELHLPCYRFSLVEISRWNRSPFSWLTSLRFSGKKCTLKDKLHPIDPY